MCHHRPAYLTISIRVLGAQIIVAPSPCLSEDSSIENLLTLTIKLLACSIPTQLIHQFQDHQFVPYPNKKQLGHTKSQYLFLYLYSVSNIRF